MKGTTQKAMLKEHKVGQGTTWSKFIVDCEWRSKFNICEAHKHYDKHKHLRKEVKSTEETNLTRCDTAWIRKRGDELENMLEFQLCWLLQSFC